MKQIPLSQGQVALVDNKDFAYLSQWKWTACWDKGTRTFYARRRITRNGKSKNIHMHRVILGATHKELVDHKNHNGIDNLRRNLRKSNFSTNQRNQRAQRVGSSRYKGVHWNAEQSCWKVQIGSGKMFRSRGPNDRKRRQIFLGRFDDEVKAALAYDAAARIHFGEFACLNFPRKGERSAI